MSSNDHFAHYICTGDYPLGANRLIIGIYFEPVSYLNWGCFIAASFYDRQNRVLWHKTVCLVLRTERNNTSGRSVDTGSTSRDYFQSGELK